LVTTNRQSPLAGTASAVVVLPDSAEACAVTNAPTTSFTMMSVVGDALAVVLLNRRGFRADDFGVLHPGGLLGAALTPVHKFMHTGAEMPLVPAGIKMEQAILEMTSRGFGCTGVVDPAGALVGIITDGDLRRHMSPTLMDRPVDAVMSRNPMTVTANATLGEARSMMTNGPRKITALFVVDGVKPVGLVHIHDCMRIARGL
jgi:arabinose-5-phosphate isomerase